MALLSCKKSLIHSYEQTNMYTHTRVPECPPLDCFQTSHKITGIET